MADPDDRGPPGFARSIVVRDEVGSTSDLARELVLAGGVELPLLVVADRQTAGRGRGSHRWWSDEGGLTFTLAIDTEAHGLGMEQQGRVALAAAVAVIEALGPILPPGAAGIRWPNDIEVGGRKLGGILPERIESRAGPRLLIGIGLNVANRLEDAPAEVRRMATTVEGERRRPAGPTDRKALLDAILGRLGPNLAGLARDDPSLAESWSRLDTLRDRPLRIAIGSRIVAGLGRGIDPRGGLRVESAGGIATFFGGQVLRDLAGKTPDPVPRGPFPTGDR